MTSPLLKLMDRPIPPLKWEVPEVPIKETPVLKFKPNPVQQHLLIAIPTNKYIEPDTFKSIFDLVVPDHFVVTYQHFHGYQVDQIRNLIANWGEKFDYVLWVDSDIILPPDTLVKMLAHNVDVVSGCYIQRIEGADCLELYCKDDGTKRILSSELNPPRLLEVGSCGFGCVLTTGEILRKMKYPHFLYKSALDHKDTISEDTFFCHKARAMGFSIWADTSIRCEHMGARKFVIAPSI